MFGESPRPVPVIFLRKPHERGEKSCRPPGPCGFRDAARKRRSRDARFQRGRRRANHAESGHSAAARPRVAHPRRKPWLKSAGSAESEIIVPAGHGTFRRRGRPRTPTRRVSLSRPKEDAETRHRPHEVCACAGWKSGRTAAIAPATRGSEPDQTAPRRDSTTFQGPLVITGQRPHAVRAQKLGGAEHSL
jgi:hypothetical protein